MWCIIVLECYRYGWTTGVCLLGGSFALTRALFLCILDCTLHICLDKSIICVRWIAHGTICAVVCLLRGSFALTRALFLLCIIGYHMVQMCIWVLTWGHLHWREHYFLCILDCTKHSSIIFVHCIAHGADVHLCAYMGGHLHWREHYFCAWYGCAFALKISPERALLLYYILLYFEKVYRYTKVLKYTRMGVRVCICALLCMPVHLLSCALACIIFTLLDRCARRLQRWSVRCVREHRILPGVNILNHRWHYYWPTFLMIIVNIESCQGPTS